MFIDLTNDLGLESHQELNTACLSVQLTVTTEELDTESVIIDTAEVEFARVMTGVDFLFSAHAELMSAVEVASMEDFSEENGQRLSAHLHTVTGGFISMEETNKEGFASKAKALLKKIGAAIVKLISSIKMFFKGLLDKDRKRAARAKAMQEKLKSFSIDGTFEYTLGGKHFNYNAIAPLVVVKNRNGGIGPFTEDMGEVNDLIIGVLGGKIEDYANAVAAIKDDPEAAGGFMNGFMSAIAGRFPVVSGKETITVSLYANALMGLKLELEKGKERVYHYKSPMPNGHFDESARRMDAKILSAILSDIGKLSRAGMREKMLKGLDESAKALSKEGGSAGGSKEAARYIRFVISTTNALASFGSASADAMLYVAMIALKTAEAKAKA